MTSSCEHCSNNSDECHDSKESCCWARALEIKKFKKHVFHKYIIEVIFDLLVSVCSVVTDIISLILYIKKQRWVIAVLTLIPVLLPTLVFTNVYMADETQGYCKLPVNNGKKLISRISEEEDSTIEDKTKAKTTATADEGRLQKMHKELDFHCSSCHFMCTSCHGICGGIFQSLCHKDKGFRNRGAQMAKKSIKRLSKYFFGTFVLRFIALAWYFKALFFGIKAFKEPKRFMKIEKPSCHWSYDLLVRLDFLQAALENAPQCVVQLYVMLVYPDENMALALLTIIFSFMDFVRVSVSVQWDLRRGPVIAPIGCYGSIFWKLLNITSWICLYVGRSAALALGIASSKGWTIAIPVVIFVVHVTLFTILFSKAKVGLAAQKLVVSVFISIFFLPELNSNELPILTQFYAAVVHIQNLIFITPWQGIDYEYCFTKFNMKPIRVPITPKSNDSIINEVNREGPLGTGNMDHCMIDPMIIVILVPVLTMIGIVLRLSASQRMSEFKKTRPQQTERMLMEERVANIYSKKWSQMTVNQMTSAFLRMLKKEVVINTEKTTNSDGKLSVISETIQRDFKKSQHFIHKTASFLTPECDPRTKRSMSVDAYAIKLGMNYVPEDPNNSGYCSDSHISGAVLRSRFKKSAEDWDLKEDVTLEVKPEEVDIVVESVSSLTVPEIQIIRVDGPNGEPLFLEMSWI